MCTVKTGLKAHKTQQIEEACIDLVKYKEKKRKIKGEIQGMVRNMYLHTCSGPGMLQSTKLIKNFSTKFRKRKREKELR